MTPNLTLFIVPSQYPCSDAHVLCHCDCHFPDELPSFSPVLFGAKSIKARLFLETRTSSSNPWEPTSSHSTKVLLLFVLDHEVSIDWTFKQGPDGSCTCLNHCHQHSNGWYTGRKWHPGRQKNCYIVYPFVIPIVKSNLTTEEGIKWTKLLLTISHLNRISSP